MKEFEIEEVKGATLRKEKKVFRIDEYGRHQEFGGLIFGIKYPDESFKPTHFIQLPNGNKDPEGEWNHPGLMKSIVPVIKKITLKDIMNGVELLGEFHSHKNNVIGLSKKDKEAIDARVMQRGFWLIGILTVKNNQKLRMSLKAFHKVKTNYNKIKK